MSVLQNTQPNEFQIDKEIERELDFMSDAEHDGFKFHMVRTKKRFPMGVPFRIGFVNALDVTRHAVGMTGGEEEIRYRLLQKNVFFRYDRRFRCHTAYILDDSKQPEPQTEVVFKELGHNMNLIARHIMDGTLHPIDDEEANNAIQKLIRSLRAKDNAAGTKKKAKEEEKQLSEADVRDMTNKDIDDEIARLQALKNQNNGGIPQGIPDDAENPEGAGSEEPKGDDNPEQQEPNPAGQGVIQM